MATIIWSAVERESAAGTTAPAASASEQRKLSAGLARRSPPGPDEEHCRDDDARPTRSTTIREPIAQLLSAGAARGSPPPRTAGRARSTGSAQPLDTAPTANVRRQPAPEPALTRPRRGVEQGEGQSDDHHTQLVSERSATHRGPAAVRAPGGACWPVNPLQDSAVARPRTPARDCWYERPVITTPSSQHAGQEGDVRHATELQRGHAARAGDEGRHAQGRRERPGQCPDQRPPHGGHPAMVAVVRPLGTQG